MLDWLKRHAWKACIPLKGIPGSNPGLSAPWFLFHVPVLRKCTLKLRLFMKKNHLFRKSIISFLLLLLAAMPVMAQNSTQAKAAPTVKHDSVEAKADSAMLDSMAASMNVTLPNADNGDEVSIEESAGLHSQLKTKFVEGNPAFMSLVALTLVLGLAFCIERIIYLSLCEINAKKLVADVEKVLMDGNVEEAKKLCRETRGPVASICYQGLLRIDEPMDDIERSIAGYGAVQQANMEKGCSWITLFIAMAPSLGFLGTVIGMVMAFDRIQQAGDISPTIVADGMKVALITTIFGIIVALILQVFYNYILSKIEHLTSQMEESAISMLDMIVAYKHNKQP